MLGYQDGALNKPYRVNYYVFKDRDIANYEFGYEMGQQSRKLTEQVAPNPVLVQKPLFENF